MPISCFCLVHIAVSDRDREYFKAFSLCQILHDIAHVEIFWLSRDCKRLANCSKLRYHAAQLPMKARREIIGISYISFF